MATVSDSSATITDDKLRLLIEENRVLINSTRMKPSNLPPRPRRGLQRKMRKLPTVKEGESLDSFCWSASTASAQADLLDVDASDLTELDRGELQRLCLQSQHAHSQLRRAYDLLVTRLVNEPSGRVRSRIENELLAAQSLVADLERALATSGVDPSALKEKSLLTSQNLTLSQKVRDLRFRESRLRERLQEMADQNELMEFRILELEGCPEKMALGSQVSSTVPVEHEGTNTETTTLETTGEDLRRISTAVVESSCEPESVPESIESSESSGALQTQLQHWNQDRRECHQKIACLQSSVLQLEALLAESRSELVRLIAPQTQSLSSTETQTQSLCSTETQTQSSCTRETQTQSRCFAENHPVLPNVSCLPLTPDDTPSPPDSPGPCSPPPGVKPTHQRSPSGASDSELSDYHSDSTDSRTPQPSGRVHVPVSFRVCSCGGLERRRSSPLQLQESGIFDVDVEEKAVQTDVQQSDVSMRELIDLSSEIARLTSVQEQLEKTPLSLTAAAAAVVPYSLAAGLRQHSTETLPAHCDETADLLQPPRHTALVCQEVQTDYYHVQLQLDYDDICGRFDKMKTSYREMEDEKNELEEAENDARLMVQRLEMKMYASSEVEKMLSSDLAEEQERSRQLQRQLNSVKLKRQAEVKALQCDKEKVKLAQKVNEQSKQLEELVQQLEESRKSTSEMEDKASGSDVWTDWREFRKSSMETDSSREHSVNIGSPIKSADAKMHSQTDLSAHLNEAWKFNDNGAAATISCVSNPFSIRPQKRLRTDDSEESVLSTDSEALQCVSEASRCAHCDRELSSQATGDSMCSNHTDRETYYTECIHELETDKSASRKRWEEEKLSLLKTAGEACQESVQLKSKLDEVIKESENTKLSLIQRVEQLKNDLKRQVEAFDNNRCELIASNEQKIKSMSEQTTLLNRRLRASEDVLNALKVELDFYQRSPGRESPDPELHLILERVRAIHHSQKGLVCQVGELEQKECAYRETLQNADTIMRDVELRYQKRIEELEGQLRDGKNRQAWMEETLNKLKHTMHSSCSNQEQEKIAELLDRLISTENAGLVLNEKMHHLEKREGELSIRLREEERVTAGLRHELQDQEQMLGELGRVRQELAATTDQLHALEALRQRVAELQQSEELLRGRVEELEQAESSLQDALKDDKLNHAHKERRNADQMNCVRNELESLHSSSNDLQERLQVSEEDRCRLRKELTETRERLAQVKVELKNTNVSACDTETQFRNEVSKLRAQLTLVNQQLSDNDAYSCQLRENVQRLEGENTSLREALGLQTAHSEQDVIKLNLEISGLEEEMALLSEQLQDRGGQLSCEMDALAEQEGTLVRLVQLVKQSDEQIQTCDKCRCEVEVSLRTAICDLEQLTALVVGSSDDQSLQSQLKNARLQNESLLLLNSDVTDSVAVTTQEVGLQTELDKAAAPSPSLGINSNDLTEQVAQLTLELKKKEDELGLVDVQGSQLQEQLELRDRETWQLRERLGQANSQLDHQRSQQDRLLEQLQRTKLVEQETAARADVKNMLLSALLRHLRAVLDVRQAALVAAAISREQQTTTNISGIPERQDYDFETVCQILHQLVLTLQQRARLRRESSISSSTSAELSAARSRIPRLVKCQTVSTVSVVADKVCSRPSLSRRSSCQSTGSSCAASRCRRSRQRQSAPPPPVGVAKPYRTTPTSSDVISVGVARPYRTTPTSSDVINVGVEKPYRTTPTISEVTNVCLTPLPCPDRFQIIREVGGNSLLLYWSLARDQRITGYEIFVDNRLQQVIRNPGRTKALLPSLQLDRRMQLAIRSVADGQVFSAFSWTEYLPGEAAEPPLCPPTSSMASLPAHRRCE